MRFLVVSSLVALGVLVSGTANADLPPCAADCEAMPVRAPRDRHEVPTKMRSIPVFATGVFFDVVGAAAVGTGIGFLAANPTDRCGYPFVASPCGATTALFDIVGIAAIAGGSVFLAIGIPLTVVGGRSVPDVDAQIERGLRVRVGATGGGVEYRF